MHPFLVAGGRGGDAAVPGRDGAVGVAGFFPAQRGEILAEACRLVRRNSGKALACQKQAGHENDRSLDREFFHISPSLLIRRNT